MIHADVGGEPGLPVRVALRAPPVFGMLYGTLWRRRRFQRTEVVFINDDSKSWVNFVVNSRKATKEDFTIGATVFYLAGWQSWDDGITSDNYRKKTWYLANITSIEELFKDRVEVGGVSYNIRYLRVPTDPMR